MTGFVMMMTYSIGFDWKFEAHLPEMTTNTKNDFKKSISCEVEKILVKNRDADKWGKRKDNGHFSKCSSIEFLSSW